MIHLLFKKKLSSEQFQELFGKYYEPIRAYIYYKCGDAEVAKDIAQETFLKAWEKRGSIELETAKAYLYQTASNLFISRWRRQKLHLNFEQSEVNNDTAIAPDEVLWDKELKGRLEDALSAMQEIHRTTFLMSRHEGLSYAEIAERLGLSEKAVQKRISTALEQLRVAFPDVDMKSKGNANSRVRN